MAPTDRDRPPEGEHRNAPTTVAPTTRVTVAFPFSTIKIHEPDARLATLAAIVADLADQLAAAAPGPATDDLRERARALAIELTT